MARGPPTWPVQGAQYTNINLRYVIKVEAFGELEVELDGGTLVRSFEGICDHYVDLINEGGVTWEGPHGRGHMGAAHLGAIKCTISWIDLPWIIKLLQRLFKLLQTYIHIKLTPPSISPHLSPSPLQPGPRVLGLP